MGLFLPSGVNVHTARTFVALGVVMGLLMGFGQVMRGAHFSLTTCGPDGGSGFPGAGLRAGFRPVC